MSTEWPLGIPYEHMTAPYLVNNEPFLRTLQSQGFARVNFPISRTELNELAARFLKFLELPDDIKQQLHFPGKTPRASADGYTDKRNIQNKDPKEFFHWKPELESKPICRQLMSTYPEINVLFQSASKIYKTVELVVSEIFQSELAPYRSSVIRGNKVIDGTLRLLCYAPSKLHSTLATGHFDKGFCTLALADSCSGLRIAPGRNEDPTAVEHIEGQAVFMPGWKLYEESKGQIEAAWHDVALGENSPAVSNRCARWAIVFFLDCPDNSYASWKEVHQRPQHGAAPLSGGD